MKVVVLAGGLSSERNVSLCTGKLVHNALVEYGHQAILLDIYLGVEAINDSIEAAFLNNQDFTNADLIVAKEVPNLEEVKKSRKENKTFFGKNVLEVCSSGDIVFLALHGESGEDGKVQATFDLLGIPYTGTGYFGSALAMNKKITRKLLRSENILVASGLSLSKKDVDLPYIIKSLNFPIVVKPNNGGSSIGVYIVNDQEELENAINEATLFDDILVIEQFIKGREFSVGIINEKALPVIEIKPKTGFYDYKNKYQAGFTEEICPANLGETETLEVQKIAEKVHKILELGSYSRVDFLLGEDNKFYCLEANTLPGMTPTSLIPQEAQVIGINYQELCNIIIETSLEKWREKNGSNFS